MKDHEVAWTQFILAKDLDKQVEYFAMRAILEYAKAMEPIPSELLPYLQDICDIWIKDKGNPVSNFHTEMVWVERVSAVQQLRNSGMKRDSAIDQIAERDNIESKSMSSIYKKSKYRSIKDMLYSFDSWGVTKK